MSDAPFHGPLGDVIRELLEAMQHGEMSDEQLVDVVASIASVGTQPEHDISVAFRTALIAQGHEEMANRLKEVKLTLTKLGPLFRYGVAPDDEADWLDSLDEEGNKAFLNASLWVLRAGNVNAYIDEDGKLEFAGPIDQPGDLQVSPADVETLVSEFVEELDRQFPDKPPPRKGSWW